MNTKENFYVTSGAVNRNSPSYVQRKADDELLAALLERKFCYVLTPRQMGKSSLVVRTAARLKERGVSVANVDLGGLGQSVNPAQWYRSILRVVGQQLGQEPGQQPGQQTEVERGLLEFWRSHPEDAPLTKFMDALQEVALAKIDRPIVIFIDEIDQVRSLPFNTAEFFTAIRSLFIKRSFDERLERITFCLLGVASLADLIGDSLTTPFNIGDQIELTDFTEKEAEPLIAGLGVDEELGASLVRRVLHWTGGHPYLTQTLCDAVAKDASARSTRDVDRVCEGLFLDNTRINDRNLLFVRENILNSKADRASLLDLYGKIHRQTNLITGPGDAIGYVFAKLERLLKGLVQVRDDETNPLVTVLRLAGITRVVRKQLAVRNRIYYRVFDQGWINTNMPDQERRRQRAAFKRGAVRIGSVAGIVLIVVAALAIIALRQRTLAVEQRNLAQLNAKEANQQRAIADSNAAEANQQRNLAQHNFEEADRQRSIAQRNAAEADRQRILAQRNFEEADRQRNIAQRNAAEANEQRKLALEKEEQAQIARRLADAKAAEAEAQRKLAENNLKEAIRQKAQAEAEKERNSHFVYSANIYLAQLAFESGDADRGQELLSEIEQNQKDLRGFEWYYLRDTYNRELATALGHDDNVTALAFSPNGASMASASEDGTIKLWNVGKIEGAKSVPEITTLQGHSGSVAAISFSPDGQSLLSAGENAVIVWDLSASNVPKKFHLSDHTGDILAAVYSPDGRFIATAGEDRLIMLWDAKTAMLIATLTEPKQLPDDVVFAHNRAISSLAFSVQGEYLVSGSYDGLAKVWSTSTHKLLTTLRGHTGPVYAVAFPTKADKPATWNPDVIATAGEDGLIRVWVPESSVPPTGFAPTPDPRTGGTPVQTPKSWQSVQSWTPQPNTTLEGHIGPVYALAFSSAILASAGRDRSIKLWSLASDKEITTLRGHTLPILALAFSPFNDQLASAGWDKSIKLWNPGTSIDAAILQKHELPILSVAYSSQGALLSGGRDGQLLRWSTVLSAGASLYEQRESINAVAVSSDGRTVVSAGWDNKVILHRDRKRLEFNGHTGPVNSVALSSDETLVASGSDDQTIRIWITDTGQNVSTLKANTQIRAVAFSSKDNNLLVAGGLDGAVQFWDLASGTSVVLPDRHKAFINAIAISPDGKTLVTGSSDFTIKVWDVATRQIIDTLTGHKSYVRAVAFSRDGKTLASGSNDGTVKLWDVRARKELMTLRGHSGFVSSVSFSPDDQTLASAGSDLTIRLWHAERREQ